MQKHVTMTFPELLTAEWLKYDKNITSILRTMGYNSMVSFQRSNALKEHYFLIMNDLKTNPEDGMMAIHHAYQELKDSAKYRSLLWIEQNAARYKAFKSGDETVKNLGNEIEKRLKDLKDLPKVLKITAQCTRVNDYNKGRMENQANNKVNLKIWYDPTITIMKNDLKFSLTFSKALRQDIRATLSPDILELDAATASSDEVLKYLFNKETLRSAFGFYGPTIYTPRSGGQSSGCLGDLNDDFQEVLEHGTIESYINFITQWLSLFNDTSNPYMQPYELLNNRNNDDTYRLLGFQSEDAIKYVFGGEEGLGGPSSRGNFQYTDINQICEAYVCRERSHNQSNYYYADRVMGLKDQTAEEVCKTCVLDKCKYNPLFVQEVVKEQSANNTFKPKEMMPDNDIEALCMMHNKLINDAYRDMPIDAQIRCLMDSENYLTPGPDGLKELYTFYKEKCNAYLLPWDKIQTYWENKYGR